MSSQRLCNLRELPDGDSRGFDPFNEGQDSVLLIRQGTQIYAYQDRCPHYGDTPMAWRRHAYLDAGRTHIVCAAHGALFDIASGACIRGPCLGDTLTSVPFTISPDGDVILHTGDTHA